MGKTLAITVSLALTLAACVGFDPTAQSTTPVGGEDTNVSAGVAGNVVAPGGTVTMGGFDVRVVGARGGEPNDVTAFDVKLVADAFSATAETTFAAAIGITARGPSGREYHPEIADCADGLPIDEVVYPDQTIAGFVCFAVEADDASGLQLVLSPRQGPHVVMQTPTSAAALAGEFGPDQVVAALIEAGVDARLVASPYGRDSFLKRAADEHVLCLDNEEAILFEYADETVRQADSDTVLPDGTFSSGHVDLYFGRVMYWANGRVIVNYNLGEPHHWDGLTAALGDSLTPGSPERGDRPPEFAGSQVCNGEN